MRTRHKMNLCWYVMTSNRSGVPAAFPGSNMYVDYWYIYTKHTCINSFPGHKGSLVYIIFINFHVLFELSGKLALKGGSYTPHFRLKHVCLKVSSNAAYLAMGCP